MIFVYTLLPYRVDYTLSIINADPLFHPLFHPFSLIYHRNGALEGAKLTLVLSKVFQTP
jgi:predicted nucleic acid binding AN1-type Zn finger protein